VSSIRIEVRAQAEAEIDQIARYIARDNLDASKRFYDAVQDALDKLAAMPGMGAPRRAKSNTLRGLRSWPIKRYDNYLIFYLPLSEGGIDVLHVVHGARNLDWLMDRQ
jgi:toxin ParE1/3/4